MQLIGLIKDVFHIVLHGMDLIPILALSIIGVLDTAENGWLLSILHCLLAGVMAFLNMEFLKWDETTGVVKLKVTYQTVK